MNLNLEENEDALLAPYAMKHNFSGSRMYPEAPDPYRTCYQRDRDRVIHSKAFRRLGYKTQVFVNTEGDNYRTRLTHSLEVSQISRSIAGALRLNRDYAETIALAHDLGHTPFGHAGQDTLHQLMRAHGGFEHNCQSLRIVSELETRYADWNGLNLSRAVLKGMMKHNRIYECDSSLIPLAEQRGRENPCLEAALVDHCDRIAYIHHDLEDALDSDIVRLEELMEINPWRTVYDEAEKSSQGFRGKREPLRIRIVIRMLLSQTINDLIAKTQETLLNVKPESLDDIYKINKTDYPVRFSETMKESMGAMQKFLHEKMYRHPRVVQMSARGSRIIEFLFSEFMKNPEMLPGHVQGRISEQSSARVVSDYISGMTDRFALKEYQNLAGIV